VARRSAPHELQRDVGKLAAVPSVLIHGRLDVSSPLDIAWNLTRAWPGSELVLLDRAGHGARAETTVVVVDALDRFAGG
jgi:proline iminopeptidase